MKTKWRCMRRPCIRCDKSFSPTTKMTRICEKCLVKGMRKRLEQNKIKREKLKEKK